MKVLKLLFFLVLSVSLAACADDPQPVGEKDRTVLVYIADGAGLSVHLSNNIRDMQTGMVGYDGNLIVYHGTTTAPRLLKIEPDGSQTVLKTYEDRSAADASVIREVVNYVFSTYPAKSRGLVFSGHGTGWEPYPEPVRSGLLRSSAPSPYTQFENYTGDGPVTRSYASRVNVDELASALPTGRSLDFILFDACFMSGAETLYALRNASKYIIASPTETMGPGYPYAKVVPLMFASTLNLTKICQAFIEFYRAYSYPSATVALINTSELEGLAGTVKTIFEQHPGVTVNLSAIQSMEAKSIHTFYDMNDYMAEVTGGNNAAYQAFATQLGKVVAYEDHTVEVYSVFGANHWFPMTRCSGINAFIPQSVPGWKTAYLETAWAQAIGYQ